MSPWVQTVLSILCQLYRMWGGPNCNDLTTDPETAASVLLGIASGGPPSFDNGKQADRFVSLRGQLAAHLADADNELSPATTAALLALCSGSGGA